MTNLAQFLIVALMPIVAAILFYVLEAISDLRWLAQNRDAIRTARLVRPGSGGQAG